MSQTYRGEDMKPLKGLMSISKAIGLVVVALVTGALIGTITDSTIGLSGGGNASVSNVTGATWTLFLLVPLFFVIAVVVSYVTDI